MAVPTYTVKKGDTLSEIAWKYNSTYNYGSSVTAAYKKLAEINDIDDPDRIVVGQVLKLKADGTTPKKTKGSQVVFKAFGLQSDTDRTVYASWAWDKSHTDSYKCIWYYDTGNGVWFVGSESDEKNKQSIYNAPSNAKRVAFKVKPVSTKRKVKKKQTSYWTGKWSSSKKYDFSSNPPSKPSAPTVTIEKYKLTAELDNLASDWTATHVEFMVVQDDKTIFKTGTSKIQIAHASFSCDVDPGHEYKVCCRGVRSKVYGDWSDYSSNVGTIPSTPEQIISIKALSKTSVSVDWSNVSNCKSYEIQYTTKIIYFDSSSNVQSQTVESVVGHAEITGLETGQEYFFRVRAVNDKGNSAWGEIKSIVLGKAPSAPTTWSSTTTGIVGEALILYWVHNAEDGSSQTFAELELIIDGVSKVYTIENSTDEEEKDKTSMYPIDTSTYTEGAKIQWRVRTAGITKEYGDWSIQRTIDIYAPPTLSLLMTDIDGSSLSVLEAFPFYIKGTAGPNTQTPISYYLVITADENYETVDQIGNTKMISKGDAVYAKYFDTSNELLVEFSAGNIDLENNITYIVTCTVAMNSGLTSESSLEFTVSWTDDIYEPNAEIGYDDDTYSTYIRPYCVDENEALIEGVTLSVYRREFDGGFVEIATNLENVNNTYVTDPHPALDYARYRIVAITTSTGAVSYYDVPGYPIEEKAVIIQWAEEWSNFDTSTIDEGDELEQPVWSGSLLRLPYNIDVSDKNTIDVSLVKYIGRKRPVSYYGTQLGESSSWKVDISKDDEETLYALRRLAIWTGDVYVREPSGSGYWANISVSFSQTHKELTIPVTLEIVRVEGGI